MDNKVEAKYMNANNETEHVFQITDASLPRYNTTNGKTTGPSEYVVKAGQEEDVDKPSDPKLSADGVTHTFLSQVRMQLTGIQDDINEYLTDKMMENRGNKMAKTED